MIKCNRKLFSLFLALALPAGLCAIEFIDVPAGAFLRDGKEGNISAITYGFSMGKYPITRQEFEEIMGVDPSDPMFSRSAKDPVKNVNWYMAIAFCNKLSLLEGLEPVYSVREVDFSTLSFQDIPITENAHWDRVQCNWQANGYRLPTEMEWMWAAMGAPADGQEGRINRDAWNKAFAGHNISAATRPEDYLWWNDNSDGRSQPVGKKMPNELGLYDMSGNIWEWCWDLFKPYPKGEMPQNYTGPLHSSYRVLRGGSWYGALENCSLASRNYYTSNYEGYNSGFRIVRAPDFPETPKQGGVFEVGSGAGLVGLDEGLGLAGQLRLRYLFKSHGPIFGLGIQGHYASTSEGGLQHDELYGFVLASLDLPLYKNFFLRGQLAIGGGGIFLKSSAEDVDALCLVLLPEIGPVFVLDSFSVYAHMGSEMIFIGDFFKQSLSLALGIAWRF